MTQHCLLVAGFINEEKLQSQKTILQGILNNGKQAIQKKKAEPSIPTSLSSANECLESVQKLISEANQRVDEHNETIRNLATAKANLKSQVWRYIIEEAKAQISTYKTKKQNLESAVQGLTRSITEAETSKGQAQEELAVLEEQITSVKPTVNRINGILASFGFTSFELGESERKGYYSLRRPSGEDARSTLSEGERTFIAFLYFYSLLFGSKTETGIEDKRIVVVDDPISSLDSTVVFVVSSLIKEVIAKARESDQPIQQVIVLTHNIYFHKEVTFDSKRKHGLRPDETFWILHKRDDQSSFKQCTENPIKNSYELLWQEIREREPHEHIGVQNTLRRILENYFKLLGNVPYDRIIAKFQGDDMLVCRSLFSWVNQGSHLTDDELHIASTEELVCKYLAVFRRIFDETNHLAHYNMMMRIEPVI